MEELWKTIPDYPDYQVSSYGSIKRITGNMGSAIAGKILKGRSARGYLCVVLCKDGNQRNIPIHKLVIDTFIGPCPKHYERHHKDGIITNNYLTNLEYVLQYKHRSSHKTGENHKQAKLKERDVSQIRQLYVPHKNSLAKLAQIFGVSRGYVWAIIHKKNWKHI